MMVVYTDASVKSHIGTGIGWHIKSFGDDENTLLKTIDKGYDSLSDQYTSEQAELLAMTRGIKEALQRGEQTHIKLRSDCKPLVEKVNNKTPVEGGPYMEALHNLLEDVEHWEVKWVPRTQNNCADRQAVVGRDQYA